MIPCPKWKITCKEDVDEILRNGVAIGLTQVTVEAQDEYKTKTQESQS